MFQKFTATSHPDQGPPRLAALREWMAHEGINGFLVPRADRHQGEYVAPCDERLSWLTGFTGSAGFTCVLEHIAGIFIDGRYRVQVRAQVAADFTPVHWPETSLESWLIENTKSGDVIGFDPWLHTEQQITSLQSALREHNVTLRSVANGVDAIWSDRPSPPADKAWAHPPEYAGKSSNEKRKELSQSLQSQGADAAVLTQPDSICWLLNIRGADVPCTPLVQAFAVLHSDGLVALFGDMQKFSDLGTDPQIHQHDWSEFEGYLSRMTGKVIADPSTAPMSVFTALSKGEAKTMRGADPCALPKACKNNVELSGARQAHVSDAQAYVEFLCWCDGQDTKTLTEISIVKKLEQFRREIGNIHDISFETISGSGPNGAIVHYRVTENTDRALDMNSLLLVDSGGQYPSGTTDITRVLPIGVPTDEMKRLFTTVLKGMISVSMLRFPDGIAGAHVDGFARAPLWDLGLDFDHGTGHGVGSFLSVHEGPQRISRISQVPLRPGMIVSNEPGYYREGEFGIRIENILAVQNANPLPGADDRKMLSFETLTLVPIDRRLIMVDLLSPKERDWLNDYHRKIRTTLNGKLSEHAEIWLEDATKPI